MRNCEGDEVGDLCIAFCNVLALSSEKCKHVARNKYIIVNFQRLMVLMRNCEDNHTCET